MNINLEYNHNDEWLTDGYFTDPIHNYLIGIRLK